MGYLNKGNKITNSSSDTWRTKKVVFITSVILNSYIIPSTCGSKIDHGECYQVLVQSILEISTREPHPQSTPRGRSNP